MRASYICRTRGLAIAVVAAPIIAPAKIATPIEIASSPSGSILAIGLLNA